MLCARAEVARRAKTSAAKLAARIFSGETMTSRHRQSGHSVIDVVAVLAMLGLALALILPAMQMSREDERGIKCLLHMKQLATAFHLYHDNQQRFPPSAFYNDGKNMGDKKIALKQVVPGKDDEGPACAPYSYLIKMLPYVEQGYIYDQINFTTRQAFNPANAALASKVVPLFNCPSYQGDQHSAAAEYQKFVGSDGKTPALTQYKGIGATTLTVLQDATLATDPAGDGGIVHPYAAYSFNNLRAPTQTMVLTETRETRYSAWWDGTTASIAGFEPTIDKGKEATKPALHTEAVNFPFMPKGSFGGDGEMQWGPSSWHPGKVHHVNGGTECHSIGLDIDPKVYAAMITRRTDDNEVLNEYFRKREEEAEKERLRSEDERRVDEMKDVVQAVQDWHNHASDHSWPDNIRGKDGVPLLSWRVTVLPLVESTDFFNEFKRDEPWDSTANFTLTYRTPAAYSRDAKSRPRDPLTRLMRFVGVGTPFPGDKPPLDVKSPASTIMFVQVHAAKAVPWTKPADLVFDPKDPFAALGYRPGDKFLAAFFDGHVEMLDTSMPLEKALAMIAPEWNSAAKPPTADKASRAADEKPVDSDTKTSA
ncbi:MAG: DUF1559 domain-containing protein, partial [Planctomycetia bacterium]|nr:DUF1559 domain-containing protein [Planctomycetia bacterium]